MDNNTRAFLALVKAGLWEKDASLLPYGDIDYKEVYRLAQEQAVVGLVAAGLDHVIDIKIPKEEKLQFVGMTLQLEQRNIILNAAIARLIEDLRDQSIYALLVKGQGIAQCYEKPLWRASGDIDLLLDDCGFIKAKEYFDKLVGGEKVVSHKNQKKKHIDYYYESDVVEIHGTLHSCLSTRIDRSIDEVQSKVFSKGDVRSWDNNGTDVFIPSPDNDVVFVFTHILQHLFKGGIGLRQICDWCRLLWTYRESLDYGLLESRIKQMGLMTEWKAFAYLSVNTLGMPKDAMPFYSSKYNRKADKLLTFILDVGNFGHNKDYSYFTKQPVYLRKATTLCRQISDSAKLFVIFPMDSMVFLGSFIKAGFVAFFYNE